MPEPVLRRIVSGGAAFDSVPGETLLGTDIGRRIMPAIGD
jgi:hypothetical protein